MLLPEIMPTTIGGMKDGNVPVRDLVREVAVLLRDKRRSKNLDPYSWDFDFQIARILVDEGVVSRAHPLRN